MLGIPTFKAFLCIFYNSEEVFTKYKTSTNIFVERPLTTSILPVKQLSFIQACQVSNEFPNLRASGIVEIEYIWQYEKTILMHLAFAAQKEP